MERPESITRDGKHYQSAERLFEWYPWVQKHIENDGPPLHNVLEALALDSFTEHNTVWMERIDKVSNAYYTFEREGNEYQHFLIPMPNDWAVIRDHQPEDMPYDRFLSRLESGIKYDVYMRHIASLTAIQEVLENV